MGDRQFPEMHVTESAFDETDLRMMQRALELAREGTACGEVPVGAVIARDGEIIGEGFNQPVGRCDPTAHAEIVALRDAAARVGNYRLVGATLYVSIEPCSMCAGALVHARIARLVFGAREPKAGAVCSHVGLLGSDFLNHRVMVEEGLLAEACAETMSDFFRGRRKRPLRPPSAE